MNRDQKKLMLERYIERRNALNWCNSGGRLTKKGADAALDWFVGACCGMELAGMPNEEIPTGMVFLLAVQGTKDAEIVKFLSED
jgi:hypothetical protein